MDVDVGVDAVHSEPPFAVEAAEVVGEIFDGVILQVGHVLFDGRGDAGVVGQVRHVDVEVVLVPLVKVAAVAPLIVCPIDVAEYVGRSAGNGGGSFCRTIQRQQPRAGHHGQGRVVRAVEPIVCVDVAVAVAEQTVEVAHAGRFVADVPRRVVRRAVDGFVDELDADERAVFGVKAADDVLDGREPFLYKAVKSFVEGGRQLAGVVRPDGGSSVVASSGGLFGIRRGAHEIGQSADIEFGVHERAGLEDHGEAERGDRFQKSNHVAAVFGFAGKVVPELFAFDAEVMSPGDVGGDAVDTSVA